MCRFQGLAPVWEENWLVCVVGSFESVDDKATPGRKPRVSDKEILEIFRMTNDPVLTVEEVAEQLPIGRRGLHDRLKGLEQDGMLSSKLAGQTMVWWSPEHTIVSTNEAENG